VMLYISAKRVASALIILWSGANKLRWIRSILGAQALLSYSGAERGKVIFAGDVRFSGGREASVVHLLVEIDRNAQSIAADLTVPGIRKPLNKVPPLCTRRFISRRHPVEARTNEILGNCTSEYDRLTGEATVNPRHSCVLRLSSHVVRGWISSFCLEEIGTCAPSGG